MGYFYRGTGIWPDTKIRCFEPDNTPTEFWIAGECNLIDALSDAILYFNGESGEDCKAMDLTISAHNIHTDCLGYDLHDPGDYTNYICITWNKS